MSKPNAAAKQTAFLAACLATPRPTLLAKLADFAGPAGVVAAQGMSDAQVASVLWSLRAIAAAR